MTPDLDGLWDFGDPALSEERFQRALEAAAGDDARILVTQIARTHGLRGDFEKARAVLAALEPDIGSAGAEARARYFLELGRTHASATHAPAALTEPERARARHAFQSALDTARQSGLDALAIDALHMFAFIDDRPEDQLAWGLAALAVIEASTQPAARRWEASVRHNVGLALHALARHAEALDQFERAVVLRAQRGEAEPVRIAYWMVAWTLRALGRLDEALAIQLRLERECEAAGQPDPHVFEELAHLYRALGDDERAGSYASRRPQRSG